MDKLKMAHEWAMKHGSDITHLTVEEAWKYADAMQAEAEKREPKGFPEAVEEWQPDWSVAPDWANYWVMDYDNLCYWTESQPRKKWHGFSIVRNERAPTFNYSGDWKNSLRERPIND